MRSQPAEVQSAPKDPGELGEFRGFCLPGAALASSVCALAPVEGIGSTLLRGVVKDALHDNALS